MPTQDPVGYEVDDLFVVFLRHLVQLTLDIQYNLRVEVFEVAECDLHG